MPGTTQPTYHWPIPVYGDSADGPDGFADLGNGIDASLTAVQTQVTTNQTKLNNGLAWASFLLGPGNVALPTTGGPYVTFIPGVYSVAAGQPFKVNTNANWLECLIPGTYYIWHQAQMNTPTVRSTGFIQTLPEGANIAGAVGVQGGSQIMVCGIANLWVFTAPNPNALAIRMNNQTGAAATMQTGWIFLIRIGPTQ